MLASVIVFFTTFSVEKSVEDDFAVLDGFLVCFDEEKFLMSVGVTLTMRSMRSKRGPESFLR